MDVIPGSDALMAKVPRLATTGGRLQAAVTVSAVGAIVLMTLRAAELVSPVLALVLQVATYAVVARLVSDFFNGRAVGRPYDRALFTRGFPAGGCVLASLFFILLNGGGAVAGADERLVPGWLAGLLGLYLFGSGLALMVRTLQTIGLDSGLALYCYFPEEGRLVSWSVYALLRHPGYAGMARLALAFGLWNGSTFALLLAVIFVFAWQPVWYGIEERELIGRFGESYRAYREQVPAIVPKRPADEAHLLRALGRRGG
jgi:protein-S-isoprenylcysteine O-methyltransferase Ste14